jgi:hypothetical protein
MVAVGKMSFYGASRRIFKVEIDEILRFAQNETSSNPVGHGTA